MQLIVREIGAKSAPSDGLSASFALTRLESLERAVPLSAVTEILSAHDRHEERTRKLRMEQIVYLVIAMNLFSGEGISSVLERLQHTWHWFFAPDTDKTAGDAAIFYRRAQLGVEPMADLFHTVCRPLATPQTQGAFLWGLRKMALDSKCFNLADAPPLAEHFGRPGSGRGQGAFPQARLVTLEEIGTRAMVNASIWPVHTDERMAAELLLASVNAEMLLFTDSGFYSFAMITAILARGAQVIARMPAGVKPQFVRRLRDGSLLVRIAPAGHHPHKEGEGLLVRLVTYTFKDPSNPGNGKTYRLATTLLNEDRFPANQIAQAYHERWDIEEGYDEIETHLLHGSAPLRSQTVMGVTQELYGLLIAHYAVRAAIHEAAVKADIDPDQISFTKTVTLVQEAIRDFQLAAPCLHEPMWNRLLTEIAKNRVQKRAPRFYPRVVKRKMSNFPLKKNSRKGYAKCLPYDKAITLI